MSIPKSHPHGSAHDKAGGGPCLFVTRSDYPRFERLLRERSWSLRGEIREALIRTDEDLYAPLIQEIYRAENRALAALLMDTHIAEVTRKLDEVEDIEVALRRIASDTFGLCMACRGPIPLEWQLERPAARLCPMCASPDNAP